MGRLELAFIIVLACAGWQFTRAAAVWVLIAFLSLPIVALYFERPSSVVLLMVGLLLVTVIKRLASNSFRATGVNLPTLMLNRLLLDRDIADHDTWVQRNIAEGPQ